MRDHFLTAEGSKESIVEETPIYELSLCCIVKLFIGWGLADLWLLSKYPRMHFENVESSAISLDQSNINLSFTENTQPVLLMVMHLCFE